MRAYRPDPGHLDVERFAADGGQLEGDWPLHSLLRLSAASHVEEPPTDADRVTWQARGERRRSGGSEVQTWLHLGVAARLVLTCQRCLAGVETPLAVDRWLRFVTGEKLASELDAESDEDVLASSRSLDLRSLAEDELLLALPLVPRHAECPSPLPTPQEVAPADGDLLTDLQRAPSPFAALAVLKRRAH